jgi:hypothetical protein
VDSLVKLIEKIDHQLDTATRMLRRAEIGCEPIDDETRQHFRPWEVVLHSVVGRACEAGENDFWMLDPATGWARLFRQGGPMSKLQEIHPGSELVGE